MVFENVKTLIALSRCEISVEKKFKLFQDEFWLYSQGELKSVLGEENFSRYSSYLFECNFDEFMDKTHKLGIEIVTLFDENYPVLLKEIDAPPIVLYYKGNFDALKMPALAVVGSRISTAYGREVTTLFCGKLAEQGFCIISGLAKGIDSVAHKSALDAAGVTVAVVANGVDTVYPAENKDLKEKILAHGGLVLSEYPPTVLPKPYMFPERNRIIAGLAKGTFVAEAGAKSGALITAYSAVENGRDLFVAPSNITSKYGKGSNELLAKFNTAFVLSPENILDYYNVVYVNKDTTEVQPQGQQIKIIEILENGKTHFEEILDSMQISFSELQSLLLEMEILGLVRKVSGNYYEL